MKIGQLITLKTPKGDREVEAKFYLIGNMGNVFFTPVKEEDYNELVSLGYDSHGHKGICIHYTNKDLIINTKSIFLND